MPSWRGAPQMARKSAVFGAHNLIHGLKAGIPCWAWVSEGVAVLKNRENLHEWWARKSPFSDSLATEENGLGIENLNQRLQRYAGAKSRALDMANYIKTEDVSNNENRKLVKKLGDCASYLVFKHYYTENKVILHGMKTCRQQLLSVLCAS